MSKEVQLALVEGMPRSVCTGVAHDGAWTLLAGNAALADFLGVPQQKLPGMSLFSLLYAREYSGAVDAIKRSREDEPLLFHAQRNTHAFLWTRTSSDDAAPGAEADSRFFFFHPLPALSGMNDDELFLREFKVILDSTHDGIWVIDGDGITVHVNKALNRIAGINAQEVLGKHVSEPMKEGLFSSCVTLKALEEKKPVTMFDDYASGTRCLNTSTPIFDDEGNVWRVVASIRDISELDSLQLKLSEAEREARYYKEKLDRIGVTDEKEFVGKSPLMRNCLRELEKAAKAPSSILILGETGTGKTLAASLIHQKSTRGKGPFVTVNCAAISPSLIEAELFGYEKGAFTGASHDGKKGFFELAHNGTLFLDEIGELPLGMQAKLLHVLDNYSFHRVGGVKSIEVSVRLIAATNRPLEQLVKAGSFRDDLFYRLRVLSLNLPPLRNHPEDIAPMSVFFLEEACRRHGMSRFFDPRVLRYFESHSWPGNVRELRATVEYLAAMTEARTIRLRDLPEHFNVIDADSENASLPPLTLREAADRLEAAMIRDALAKAGSTYKAAALLGVSQSTVVRKARKLHLAVPDDAV